MKNFRRILVATDLTEMSPPLYALAEQLAHRSGGRLIVVHIADRDEYVELVRETRMGLDEYLGKFRSTILYDFEQATGIQPAPQHMQVDVPLRERSVAQGLLHLAARHQVDLIVIGTHGRSGIRRALLGSVAEEVLRHATCPVLVVPKLAAGVVEKAAEAVPAVSRGE